MSHDILIIITAHLDQKRKTSEETRVVAQTTTVVGLNSFEAGGLLELSKFQVSSELVQDFRDVQRLKLHIPIALTIGLYRNLYYLYSMVQAVMY